jgi:hypothetical protein
LNLLFAVSLATALASAGVLTDPVVSFACDTLIRVFAVFFTCLLFLYYWEATGLEQKAEPDVPGPAEVER